MTDPFPPNPNPQQLPPRPIDFDVVLKALGEPDSKNAQVAELEKQVQELKDRNYEERFIWILIIIGIADAYIFSHIENLSGPIVIGIVELIVILVLADRFKVNAVAPLIDKLTGALGGMTGKGK